MDIAKARNMTKENMNDISMVVRQPAFGGQAEVDRLRKIYDPKPEPETDWENEGGAVPFKESNITVEE